MGPLLTLKVHDTLSTAARAGETMVECSLDLDRSTVKVALDLTGWTWQGQKFPYLEVCKDRTIYYWVDESFQPVARFTTSLIKLIPTRWGAPTFEIDGIQMLPTAKISPFADAEYKVGLIQPRGKVILDTCGGLGYFAAWCLQGQAKQVLSYEKNPSVIWLRELNPWSPKAALAHPCASRHKDILPKVDAALCLTLGDINAHIVALPNAAVDAILHDPPRFGTAGELYSQVFYDHLARVLKRRGKLFHYTGTPNKLTSGRDVPNEVAQRLRRAGFIANLKNDGVLAVKP